MVCTFLSFLDEFYLFFLPNIMKSVRVSGLEELSCFVPLVGLPHQKPASKRLQWLCWMGGWWVLLAAYSFPG